MPLKYDQLDQRFLSWLRQNDQRITTSRVIRELGITSLTEQRHISRRFTQLEDRGTLVCVLEGVCRVCRVVGQVPATLSRQKLPKPVQEALVNQNIIATTSEEFLARGGTIVRLPAAWDDPRHVIPKGSLPLGEEAQGMTLVRLKPID